MCEINPKHALIFRLEAFTSHSMTADEFKRIVYEKLVEAEQGLNEDGRFRFHIHELIEGES